MTTGHFADTEQKLQKTPKEMYLRTASENRQRWCGRDVSGGFKGGGGRPPSYWFIFLSKSRFFRV